MRSSKIKKNGGMSGVDIKCSKHDLWFLKRHFCRQMVHFSSVGWPWIYLLVAIMTLGCLLILLPWTMISITPNLSTAIAYVGGARHTALHRSIVATPLTCRLIAILLLGVYIAIMLLILRTLLVWVTIPLTRWSLVPLL
jgi:hypothetical protein